MRTNVSYERVNEPAVDYLVVLTPALVPVPNLGAGDFTFRLKTPLGINVASSTTITVEELVTAASVRTGIYKVTYTPNMVGNWLLSVFHPTYFPWGKYKTYVVYDALYNISDQAIVSRNVVALDINNDPVPDIDTSEFVVTLWNPSGTDVTATVPVTVTDIGNGTYRATWTANASGRWCIRIVHATYFSYGKYQDVVYIGPDSGADGEGIVEAIEQLIASDATMRARLMTYEFTTDVSSVAVFTTEFFPQDVKYPAVIIHRAGGTDWGARGHEGEDAFIRVRLYGDHDYEATMLRRTAEILRRLLNRAQLTLTDGNQAFRCIADPPALTSDEDGFPGYEIDVRALLIRL